MTGVDNIELPQFSIIDYKTLSKKVVFATGIAHLLTIVSTTLLKNKWTAIVQMDVLIKQPYLSKCTVRKCPVCGMEYGAKAKILLVLLLCN